MVTNHCLFTDPQLLRMEPYALVSSIFEEPHCEFLSTIKRYQLLHSNSDLWIPAIHALFKTRIAAKQTLTTPVFTSIGSFENGRVTLPSYKLFQPNDPALSQCYYDQENDLYLTHFAHLEFLLTPEKIPTFEQLTTFCQAVADEQSLFVPAQNEEGCFARLQIALDFLHLLRIPKEILFKHYLLTPEPNTLQECDDPRFQWYYHVAVGICIPGAAPLIIDPGFCTNPEPINHWTTLILKNTDLPVVSATSNIYPLLDHFNVSQFTHLVVPINYQVMTIEREDSYTFRLMRLDESHKDERTQSLNLLAYLRLEYESQVMAKFKD